MVNQANDIKESTNMIPATSNGKEDLERGAKESKNTKNEIKINKEASKVLSK